MSMNNERVRRLRLRLMQLRRCQSRDARKVLLNDFRKTERRCRDAGRKAAKSLSKEAA